LTSTVLGFRSRAEPQPLLQPSGGVRQWLSDTNSPA
jgi:hypothetical protein